MWDALANGRLAYIPESGRSLVDGLWFMHKSTEYIGYDGHNLWMRREDLRNMFSKSSSLRSEAQTSAATIDKLRIEMGQ